jgi:hypothetical protein
LDTASIISELEAERDRLDRAIAALRGSRAVRGRRAGAANGRSRGPRHLSAEARRKIAESARKRWAKAKAAGKNKL